MTFDERGLVALVITWHPLFGLLAMGLAALFTWFAFRFVRDIPFAHKPVWVAMMYFGASCIAYDTLTELFHVTPLGVDWISLALAPN